MTVDRTGMRSIDPTTVDGVSVPDERIPAGVLADSLGSVRKLSAELDADGFAVNHYELAPGQSFTIAPHAHTDQEELFVVLSGDVTFEGDEESETVGSGELLYVPPGTYQLGTNHGDQTATALALGVPREYPGDTHWQMTCEACDDVTVHDVVETEDGEAYECTACGTRFD